MFCACRLPQPGEWLQGKTDQVEHWYRTDFSQQSIPEDWIQKWRLADSDALFLPELNPFIPTDFDLLKVRPSVLLPWQC